MKKSPYDEYEEYMNDKGAEDELESVKYSHYDEIDEQENYSDDIDDNNDEDKIFEDELNQ